MVFFFFKQKTAYEMRISDWSSDVCSSDLRSPRGQGGQGQHRRRPQGRRARQGGEIDDEDRRRCKEGEPGENSLGEGRSAGREDEGRRKEACLQEIGRASCRERVCPYV